MGKLQRVEELTAPPIIGRFYLVPCVEITSLSASGRKPGFWPVTGPQHEDKEHIGFPWRHWHYDRRFMSDNQYQHVAGYGSVLNANRNGSDRPSISGVAESAVIKTRMCVRELPAFPIDQAERAWLPKLRAAYADDKVKCGKCPHRGLLLSSLPREPGTDIVTCPGHGLRWDLSTGSPVRRPPTAPASK